MRGRILRVSGSPPMAKEAEAVCINLRYIITPRPGILESAAQSTITWPLTIGPSVDEKTPGKSHHEQRFPRFSQTSSCGSLANQPLDRGSSTSAAAGRSENLTAQTYTRGRGISTVPGDPRDQ